MGNERMPDNYGTRPCYAELAAVLAAGAIHIVTELAMSQAAAAVYNVAVSLLFLGYLLWRVSRNRAILRHWGFRADNWKQSAAAQLPFVGVAVLGLAGYGLLIGSPGLPTTFWLTAALYPVWGIAQQFALQNLIANNLTGLIRRPPAIAFVAATLFAVSHYPRLELVALTFVAGFFLTWIYRRTPNLWVLGTVHGLLGSLAFYIVLGEDPGAVIVQFLRR